MAEKRKAKKPYEPDLLDVTTQWARDTTAGGLKDGHTLVEIARQVPKIAEEVLRDVSQHSFPEQPLACKEGCSWCCHQTVFVNATEVLSIADYVRSNLSPDAIAELKERLARFEEQIRGMSDDRRKVANLPCALLVSGRCSVYLVRPLVCAGYNSYDASKCERATRGLEKDIPWFGLRVFVFMKVGEGVKLGLGQSRLSGADLELTAALRIALDDPEAAERFLAREPVFQPAKVKGS